MVLKTLVGFPFWFVASTQNKFDRLVTRNSYIVKNEIELDHVPAASSSTTCFEFFDYFLGNQSQIRQT